MSNGDQRAVNQMAFDMWIAWHGGRPTARKLKPLSKDELKVLTQSYCPEALKVLVETMRSEDTPPATRLEAVKILLDRGYGGIARVRPTDAEEGDDESIRITIRHVLDDIPGKPYKLIESNGVGNGHDGKD